MTAPIQTTDNAALRAHAHMDEVNEAHGRGEETDAERRLRNAREGLSQGDATGAEPRGEEGGYDAPSEPVARSKPRGRPKGARRPDPRAAGQAYAAREAEERSVRRETIEFPAQALAIWREVGAELADERRYGERRGGIGKPKGASRPAPMVGDRLERQVYDRVELTRRALEPGQTLEDGIEAWPLPATFYDPAPPLCPADVDLLRKEDLAREAERKRDEERERGGERLLLPGMGRR